MYSCNQNINISFKSLFCLAIGLSLALTLPDSALATGDTAGDTAGDNNWNSEESWSSLNSTESEEKYFASIKADGCGIRPANRDFGFIVGGAEAKPHTHPWAVAVYQNNRFICGATIISENFVLCAAHCCVQGNSVTPAKSFKLRIGAHALKTTGQLVDVQEVIVHKGYDANYQLNDIALFRLKSPLNFREMKNIGFACLPTPEIDKQEKEYVGKMATIVGWGTMHSGGTPVENLRQVQVPVMSNSDCVKSYNSRMITSQQLCAGFVQGGKDSCQGDSGGSLCIPVNDRWVQFGIVSWGKGCAEAGFPGVYTRVSKYIDWISKSTKRAF